MFSFANFVKLFESYDNKIRQYLECAIKENVDTKMPVCVAICIDGPNDERDYCKRTYTPLGFKKSRLIKSQTNPELKNNNLDKKTLDFQIKLFRCHSLFPVGEQFTIEQCTKFYSVRTTKMNYVKTLTQTTLELIDRKFKICIKNDDDVICFGGIRYSMNSKKIFYNQKKNNKNSDFRNPIICYDNFIDNYGNWICTRFKKEYEVLYPEKDTKIAEISPKTISLNIEFPINFEEIKKCIKEQLKDRFLFGEEFDILPCKKVVYPDKLIKIKTFCDKIKVPYELDIAQIYDTLKMYF